MPAKEIKSVDKDRYMLSVTEIIPGHYERFVNRMDYQQPHKRNYFVFFLVTSGYIQQSIDFKSIQTKKGSLFFTSPDQVYFVEKAKNIGGIGISFTEEVLSKKVYELPIIQNLHHLNECELEPSEYAISLDLLKKMQEEYCNKGSNSQLFLESQLSSLLVILSRAYQRISSSNFGIELLDSTVLKFRSHLNKHWKKSLSVSEYANMLHISPGHLNFLIKKYTGKKPIDWIVEKKLVEAKRQLLHTENSAKEIAFDLGFEDPGYFNRFFKRYTHTTPLEFRREIREKYNGLR
ncbi:MAG: AraC family transcriptional regulator [Bacteroidetes bacterium]|nr:MAG: AraC family transcriptional regulator [Bacteroidota bacterium]